MISADSPQNRSRMASITVNAPSFRPLQISSFSSSSHMHFVIRRTIQNIPPPLASNFDDFFHQKLDILLTITTARLHQFWAQGGWETTNWFIGALICHSCDRETEREREWVKKYWEEWKKKLDSRGVIKHTRASMGIAQYGDVSFSTLFVLAPKSMKCTWMHSV